MKPILPILIILILLFAPSCEDDFSMNADYQDITVVFGLLDPGEDTIFLRINKAFLGEGNVIEMAKIQDSSTYMNGLQAVIEEWVNGNLVKSYNLDTITISNKEAGTFYNPYQIVYFAPFEPNTAGEYRLQILVNNKEVTAKTTLVNNFSITKPSLGLSAMQFKPDTDSDVAWKSAKNGRRYEVMIRFNYREAYHNNPDTLNRSIDWVLGTRKSINTNGGEDMQIFYSNNGFYTLIKDRIPYDDPSTEANVKARFTVNVDVFVAVAAEEMNTYMEVNEPSNSIVQDRPDYSNITNGIGLFSSRYLNIRTKRIHLETVQSIKTQVPELKFEF